MTKWDKIVIAVLIIISFVPYIALTVFNQEEYTTSYAVVWIDQQEYTRIPLTGQSEEKIYSINTRHGQNVLRVENEQIAVVHADCLDQVCAQTGYIDAAHEIIVCLPHNLYVEIEGSMESDQEIDIRGY